MAPLQIGRFAGDAVTRPVGRGGSAAKRCLECGVEFRAGDKYCEFCGTKVSDKVDIRLPAERRQALAVHGSAAGMLKGLAAVCLAIGILVYVGSRFRGQGPSSPTPPPVVADGKHQAAATCEAAIRAQVPAPFRVIAFRSTLVAEEREGSAVSGSVELQSAAGELQRKRYFCRVHPDARAGMVLDEGKMY